MRTNGKVTLYARQKDGSYKRSVVDALWDEHHRISSNKAGVFDGGITAVYIAPECSDLVKVNLRDYVVRGACSTEISATCSVARLMAAHKARTIKSVAYADYGAARLHHWELEVQ